MLNLFDMQEVNRILVRSMIQNQLAHTSAVADSKDWMLLNTVIVDIHNDGRYVVDDDRKR